MEKFLWTAVFATSAFAGCPSEDGINSGEGSKNFSVVIDTSVSNLKDILSFDLAFGDIGLFLELKDILKNNDCSLIVDRLVNSIFLLVNELKFGKLGSVNENVNIISKIIDLILLIYLLYHLVKLGKEGNVLRVDELLFVVLNDIIVGPFGKSELIKNLISFYDPNFDKIYAELIKNVFDNYGEIRNYEDLQSMIIEKFNDYFEYMDIGIRVSYMFPIEKISKKIEEINKMSGKKKEYVDGFLRLVTVIRCGGDFSNEKIVKEFEEIFENYYKGCGKSFDEFKGWFEDLKGGFKELEGEFKERYRDLYDRYIFVKEGNCGDECKNKSLDSYIGDDGFLFDNSPDCVEITFSGERFGLDFIKKCIDDYEHKKSIIRINTYLHIREICNGKPLNLRYKLFTYGEWKRLLESMIIYEIREKLYFDSDLSGMSVYVR